MKTDIHSYFTVKLKKWIHQIGNYILIPVFLFFASSGFSVEPSKTALSGSGLVKQTGVAGDIPEALKKYKNIHPRLFMTTASQKMLKEKINSQPYAEMLGKLKVVADKAVESGAPAYRPGSGYDEQLWQREVGNAIPELAMMYCLTGIPKYLNSARDYMLTSASYPTWGIGDIDNADLATGHQLFGIALGYDWLYNDLDKASLDSIRNCLLKRGSRSYELLSTGKIWWHDKYLHNHQHVNVTGLAAAGLALYGENKDVDNWIMISLQKLKQAISTHPPDGGWLEGIPYSGYSVEFLMKFMVLSNDLLGENLFTESSFFRNIATFRLYGMIPMDYWEVSKSRLMSIGDGPRSDWYGPDYLLRKLASEYNNGYAQWLANKMDSAGYTSFQAAFLNLLWVNPAIKPESPARLPTFKHFNDLDIVYMRSGWEGKESLAMFKCGPWIGHHAASIYTYDPYGGHTHPDVGTFLIFSHGDWLITDEGYAWKRTIYQNTLMINGKGQIGEGRWFSGSQYVGAPKQPRIVYTSSNKEYDYMIGNAKPAYPSSTHLSSFYRHILYLKPDCWVIADEVTSDSTSLFEFYYHSDFPFIADGDNKFKVEGSRGSMSMSILKPSDTDNQAFLQDIDGTGGGIAGRINTLKVSSKDKTNELFITVIESYPTGKSPLIRSSLIKSKNGMILILDSPAGKKQFRVDAVRSDKNKPLLVEAGLK